MPVSNRWRHTLLTSVAAAPLGAFSATAQVGAKPGAAAGSTENAVVNSDIDAPLFYQLLIGEMELRAGQPGTAYEVILDAARRTRDPLLFRRAVDVALEARAGDQALAGLKAWRQALPQSQDALRLQLQILGALNRTSEAAEPLRSLLSATAPAERAGLIAAIPRFFQRATNPRQSAQLIEDVLKPYVDAPATQLPSLVAMGRAWLAADEAARALALAKKAHQADPKAPGPALLAMELMPKQPEAEALVLAHLAAPSTEPALRLAYVRILMSSQRYVDAIQQLEVVVRDRPELPAPYLSLGALQLELRQTQKAEVALQRYVQLAQAAPPSARPPEAASSDDDEDEAAERPEQGLIQAWLLLAQAAEQRGDFAAAESWLARIEDPKRALDVQSRRATLLARQGKVAEARDIVRRTPEREPGDARAKLVAEAGVLREVKRWGDAFEVLGMASQRFPDDPDLIYEQAMMAEKMNRLDEMERLLRRVIELKPDNAHAHNALGYSLADRQVRLPEARDLIRRALDLSPGDPFITDSLGWVEFRLGNRDEALRLLRQAYAARPDAEIGAHLGEVLWISGQRDEARRVLREAVARDGSNDVLRETLSRLKVDL